MAKLVEPQVSRYQEYKPTGVEWMPEIPVEWEVKKLKFVATINPSRDSSKLEESAESVIFLPMEAVGEDGSFRQDTFKALADVQSGYTYFEQDDVLLAKITPCFENGKATVLTGLLTSVGFGSTEFHVVRPKQDLTISRFLFYTVKSELFLRLGEGVMVGSAGQKRVPTDFLTEFPLPVPSLEEQEAIVQFLDNKTAQLDQLITQKQQMLELLREERAALINHAVTKGLDAAAPLRDSGVEWLGEVPAHWEVKRLKFISPSISVGLVINPSTYHDDNGTVPMISGKNVTENGIDIRDVKFITEESSKALIPSKLNAGDLVSIRVGYPGLTAVVPEELHGINCASVMIIRKGPGFHSPFLSMLMNSQIGMQQVDVVAYGSAQKQFNVGHAIEFVFPLPPLEEQLSISEEVNRQESKIVEATNTINQEIALLQEYRAALIAEAVTGQLDVRHYTPAPVPI